MGETNSADLLNRQCNQQQVTLAKKERAAGPAHFRLVEKTNKCLAESLYSLKIHPTCLKELEAALVDGFIVIISSHLSSTKHYLPLPPNLPFFGRRLWPRLIHSTPPSPSHHPLPMIKNTFALQDTNRLSEDHSLKQIPDCKSGIAKRILGYFSSRKN